MDPHITYPPLGITVLKLKGKLKYHGHQYYESVRPAVVYDALDYLRNDNTLYSKIDIVKTNIDNGLVSFENPQELPADTNKSHDDEELPSEFCNLKLVVHMRIMVRAIVL